MRISTVTTSRLQALPDGESGIRETMKLMRQLVRTGKKNTIIRMKALSLITKAQQKDWLSEIKALHEFVRDHIRYVKDTRGVEVLHTPEKLLEIGQGDCDDKSILLASLLESIGHPTRFIVMSQVKGKFCHVFVETKVKDKWISLETTEPVPMGWKPKNIHEILTIHN